MAYTTDNTSDFIGEVKLFVLKAKRLKQYMSIIHKGTLRWTISDKFGTTEIIEPEGYFIPSSEVKLLSTQAYFQKYYL